ncbi:HIT family protein [Georgenia thermotolerans]|uniref:HIT domain-containing protein n=1 Tax=Georgenia thermotolerans TaxID=527326 RepID=A0A7J5USC5_9MICO|nr:HIT family protein [Georgenia thermotolerans]KAE8765218.1 HIT domain-containing protein [Georgenia thermotolerans]
MSCVFCGIAAGTEPASVVRDAGEVLAFLTTAPVNPGHVLVVPRAHATGLADLPPETGAAIWRLAHELAVALRADPGWSEGVNLHLSDGAAAGQHVFHVHLHVIPRRADDGLRITDERHEPPSRAELDDVAARLRQLAERGMSQRGDDVSAPK